MATTNQTGQGRPEKGGRRRVRASRRAQSEQTELQLLRTATWLFAERGFHGTGIRDIAEAAEVAVSAMYYYASSKDELLEAVIRRTLDVLADSVGESARAVDDPAERLATLVAVHVAFHARNPRASRVADHQFQALTGRTRREVQELRDAYESLWAVTLEEGIRDGVFKGRDSVARFALLQMATGVAHWYRPRGKLSIQQLCERFADMALALMGANRDGHPIGVADVRLPDPRLVLQRVELTIEPRRKPPGL